MIPPRFSSGPAEPVGSFCRTCSYYAVCVLALLAPFFSAHTVYLLILLSSCAS